MSVEYVIYMLESCANKATHRLKPVQCTMPVNIHMNIVLQDESCYVYLE